VDLCSVSGCKPNYLTYNAAPNKGVVAGTGSADGGKIQIRVPASALGNPTTSSLLEEAMAFVTASPQSGVVPQNNGTDFTDQAPLQLEGTKTVNVRFGAAAAVPPTVVRPGSGSGGGNPSSTPPTSGGQLPRTGLNAAVPAVAVLLVLAGLFVARRRRSGS
jgi:LPXTG-motif cell wall-anchored protein